MNWRRFWQRRKRDEDLREELESYLAHEADLSMLRVDFRLKTRLGRRAASWETKRL